jgi:hypothetical protein
VADRRAAVRRRLRSLTESHGYVPVRTIAVAVERWLSISFTQILRYFDLFRTSRKLFWVIFTSSSSLERTLHYRLFKLE